MKRSDPWFKCHTADYLEGTRTLTPEQRGIYMDCLCLLYEFGKPLPDDDKWMSHQLHISPRLWRSIRDALLAVGKLVKTEEGYTNPRAQSEINSRATQTRARPESASKQTRTEREPELNQPRTNSENSKKPNENYAGARADLLDKKIEKKDTPPTPSRGVSAKDALRAFELYNEKALKLGLKQASKMTPGRKSKLSARLREFGMDGWERALGNIAKSKFLMGGGSSGFQADLDFMLQAKSYAKLHDGGYGHDRQVEPDKPVQPLISDEKWQRQQKSIEAFMSQYAEDHRV